MAFWRRFVGGFGGCEFGNFLDQLVADMSECSCLYIDGMQSIRATSARIPTSEVGMGVASARVVLWYLLDLHPVAFSVAGSADIAVS